MTIKKGIGGHHRGFRGLTNEWLTPPAILKALGGWEAFDLDPCSPVSRPWPTAMTHLAENGLDHRWQGRVWLNPPYGPDCAHWLAKMATHGNGIAIVFARTETAMFFAHVWPRAHGILFLEGRLHFHRADGTRARANAGAPSCLVAYGFDNADILKNCGLPGAFVPLEPVRVCPSTPPTCASTEWRRGWPKHRSGWETNDL